MNWVYITPNKKTYCDKRYYKNYYVNYLTHLGYKLADTGDCFAEYPAAVIYEKKMSNADDGLGYSVGDIIYFMSLEDAKGFDYAGVEYQIIPESVPESSKKSKKSGCPKEYTCVIHIEQPDKFKIKKVIYNDPATIVLWEDGTKTVVKCQVAGKNQYGEYREKFDKEKGLALCFMKKALGNTCEYNNVFREVDNG